MTIPSRANIINDKATYAGLAMFAIILCHLNTVSVAWQSILRFFTPGFIGVDFFLFLSGWSLCYSWKKNNLKSFYSRRVKRIFPLYLVLAIIVSLLFVVFRGDKYNLIDWICNLTTLNYWGLGGSYIDWYLPAILAFYLLFPLLFWVISKSKLIGATIILAICGIVICLTDFHWRFDAAIARLPIFCLGILFFVDKSKNKKLGFYGCLVFLAVFFLSVLSKIGINGFYLTDCVGGA